MMEEIFIWTGWTLLMLIMVSIIFVLVYWLSYKIPDQYIAFKAIFYTILSEQVSKKKNASEYLDTSMKKGRKWWVRYKGKNYKWECIEEENV